MARPAPGSLLYPMPELKAAATHSRIPQATFRAQCVYSENQTKSTGMLAPPYIQEHKEVLGIAPTHLLGVPRGAIGLMPKGQCPHGATDSKVEMVSGGSPRPQRPRLAMATQDVERRQQRTPRPPKVEKNHYSGVMSF